MHVEILCKVVDNFGDAGVCARLARQLADEYGCAVRIWTDKPELVSNFLNTSFRRTPESSSSRVCGDTTPLFGSQTLARLDSGVRRNEVGVEVESWPAPFPVLTDPGEMVIEAFACGTPPALIDAMKSARQPPLWINLEYLSAEPWVDECHGKISLHPSGLRQHFIFPGFTDKTGGLIVERGLITARDGFDPAPFWQQFGAPTIRDELRVSLFCYDTAPVDDLLTALAALPQPVRLFYPEGQLGGHASTAGLTLHPYPFLSHPDFDRLLWACDLNFVRGEDSFARASLAAKPFIWQIYKQAENAHFPKLEAFLSRFCAFLTPEDAEKLALVHKVWNLPARGDPSVWRGLFAALPTLRIAAREWARQLAARQDLAATLMQLARDTKGSQS